MLCAVENGWGGRSRTPTYGTRNRCPTIRRHPIDFSMSHSLPETRARMDILRIERPFVKVKLVVILWRLMRPFYLPDKAKSSKGAAFPHRSFYNGGAIN